MNSLNVKKGDNVIVLTGQDKGKKGTVISASPKKQTVRVEGVNVVTKHVKPRGPQNPGGMMKEPGNIHVSNVQIICPDCGKPTRVGHAIVDGKKARVCKHCGASLDQAGKSGGEERKEGCEKAKEGSRGSDDRRGGSSRSRQEKAGEKGEESRRMTL